LLDVTREENSAVKKRGERKKGGLTLNATSKNRV